MSTALISHHRISNPLAAAAAVIVIAGGATLVGVAMSQGDDAAPSAPSAPAQVNPNPPSRVGQGDFNQSQKGTDHRNTYRGGGHPQLGMP